MLPRQYAAGATDEEAHRQDKSKFQKVYTESEAAAKKK